MNVLTVCSGIGAPEVAWCGLGWHYVAGADIEPFPNAVRAHHFPEVPNWGDMTKFAEWPDATIDLLVGGTPCQSFSVAGLRKGLADPRGNLALTFLAIAAKYAPRWILWENVPGVLSSGQGRDFGSFLGGLAQCGYGWAYRVLDAQYFGVPQRRRRVFVVGHLGDWRRAAAVLFERHSLQGHPAPRRETGQAAPTIPSRSSAGGGLGTDFDCDGGLIEAFGGNNCSGPIDVATACQARGGPHGRLNFESETFIAIQERAVSENPDNGPQGAGFRTDGQAFTLEARNKVQAVCFTAKDHGADASDISPTLRSGSHSGSHANGGVMPAVAFMENQRGELRVSNQTDALSTGGGKPGQGYPAVAFTASEQANSYAWERDVYPTLNAQVPNDSSNIQQGVRLGSAVRRLTPRECERLQGFPDDYTAVPYRGKPAADGPRYKALGNSMAVPVMRFIGERIAMVEELSEQRSEAA